MSKPYSYSDLQVVPSSAPEYYSGYGEGLEPVAAKQEALPKGPYDDALEPEQHAERRICGLSRRTFWIVLVVAILVIAGAVAGGVAGGLSSKNKSDTQSQGPSETPSNQTNSTPTPTSTVAITTTTIRAPKYTLLRDCPSSNISLYTIKLGSNNMNFRKACGQAFLNTIQSGADNVVNKPTASLDDCIQLCAAYNIQNSTRIAAGKDSVCNAVCWRNSLDNDDFPGQCFGFTTQNSTNSFVIRQEAKCDSAAWVDQKLL